MFNAILAGLPFLLALHSVSAQPNQLYKDGDIIIGAVMSIHEANASRRADFDLAFACGDLIPSRVLLVSQFRRTVAAINSNPNILPGVKLGYNIIDTCSLSTVATVRAMQWATSKVTATMVRPGIITQPKPVAVVVGTEHSRISAPLNMLLQQFKIPQVDFGATSSDLSDRRRYRYYTRASPPDVFQARAMASLVYSLGWQCVHLVYSQGLYGEMAIEELKVNLAKFGICTASEAKAPIQNSNYLAGEFDRIVTNIEQTPSAAAIICFCERATMRGLLESLQRSRDIAQNLGQFRPRFVILASDAWGTSSEIPDGLSDVAAGAITLRVASPEVPDFKEWFSEQTPFQPDADPWFLEFWEEKFHCTFRIDDPLNRPRCTLDPSIRLSSHEVPTSDQLGLMTTAIYAAVNGLQKQLSKACAALKGEKCTPDRMTWLTQRGAQLHPLISNVSFELPRHLSRSGAWFKFDEKGEGPARYEYHVYKRMNRGRQPFGYIKIGEWSSQNPTASLYQEAKSLITWPDTNALVTSVCACRSEPFELLKRAGCPGIPAMTKPPSFSPVKPQVSRVRQPPVVSKVEPSTENPFVEKTWKNLRKIVSELELATAEQFTKWTTTSTTPEPATTTTTTTPATTTTTTTPTTTTTTPTTTTTTRKTTTTPTTTSSTTTTTKPTTSTVEDWPVYQPQVFSLDGNKANDKDTREFVYSAKQTTGIQNDPKLKVINENEFIYPDWLPYGYSAVSIHCKGGHLNEEPITAYENLNHCLAECDNRDDCYGITVTPEGKAPCYPKTSECHFGDPTALYSNKWVFLLKHVNRYPSVEHVDTSGEHAKQSPGFAEDYYSYSGEDSYVIEHLKSTNELTTTTTSTTSTSTTTSTTTTTPSTTTPATTTSTTTTPEQLTSKAAVNAAVTSKRHHVSGIHPSHKFSALFKQKLLTQLIRLPGYTDKHRHCKGGAINDVAADSLEGCQKICDESGDECIGITVSLRDSKTCFAKTPECELTPGRSDDWTFLRKDGHSLSSLSRPSTKMHRQLPPRQHFTSVESFTSFSTKQPTTRADSLVNHYPAFLSQGPSLSFRSLETNEPDDFYYSPLPVEFLDRNHDSSISSSISDVTTAATRTTMDQSIFDIKQTWAGFSSSDFVDVQEHCKGGSLETALVYFDVDRCKAACRKEPECVGVSLSLGGSGFCFLKTDKCNMIGPNSDWTFLKRQV